MQPANMAMWSVCNATKQQLMLVAVQKAGRQIPALSIALYATPL
jgi:hypothetical protein